MMSLSILLPNDGAELLGQTIDSSNVLETA
jgi:hypothetical protein